MADTPLSDVLRDIIRQRGGISIGEYMAMCLGHPKFGYYMTHEPFGSQGDFTTSPEISQLFGEVVAVWIAATWQQLGSPEHIQLVELGPGRGTLVHDIWRGLSALPALRDKLSIHLVEFSPRLQTIQKEKLAGLHVTWHTSFDSVPQHTSIIIANEFFDALPIEQAIYHNEQWHQRVVMADDEDFLFGLGPALQGIHTIEPADHAIYEYAPAAAQIMDNLCQFLKNNGGAFLTFDYGDDVELHERFGETLQAIFQQHYDGVLDHPGEADLTAHVSFTALKQIANESKLIASIQTQREFLTQHGICLRADKLLANASTEQASALQAGLHRLIDANEMGDLFKVLQIISN